MGVRIDVEARADQAQKELAQINRQLAEILKNAQSTSATLKNLKGPALSDTNKKLKESVTGFKLFGKESNKALTKTDDNIKKTNKSLFSMKTLILSTVAAFTTYKGVSVFNKVADDLTKINNRLSLVISNTEELAIKQRQLYQISRDTYSELAQTTDIYVDFTKALERTGRGNRGLNGIITTFQKMGALSGSSRESLAAAFIQFNQGLASGTLRGEELNSVMEQMKYFSFGLQKALNMNAGSLRKFAEEGKLTSDIILDVIQGMTEEVDRDFKKFNMTVEQSVTRLQNTLKYVFGNINQYFGFSTSFGKKVNFVAKSVENLADTFSTIGFIVEKGLANFKRNFDRFSAFELTAKALINLDISLPQAFSSYQRFKLLKETKEQIDEVFKNTFFKKKIEEQKVSTGDKILLSVGIERISDEDINRTKDVIVGLIGLSNIASSAVLLVVTNIKKAMNLFPVIIAPVNNFTKSALTDSATSFAKWYGEIRKGSAPVVRDLRGLAESLNPFLRATNIERSFVKIFQSKSFDEFSVRLASLRQEIQRGRDWDFRVAFGDVGSWFQLQLEPLNKLLISFGLMEQKVVRINGFRFDRLNAGLEITGKALNMLMSDVVVPTVLPALAKLVLNTRLYLRTWLLAMSGTFNKQTGIKLANDLADGILTFFRLIAAFDFNKAFDLNSYNNKGGILARMFSVDNITGEILLAFKKAIFDVSSFVFFFTKTLLVRFSRNIFTAVVAAVINVSSFLVSQIKATLIVFKEVFDAKELFNVSIEFFKETLVAALAISQELLMHILNVFNYFKNKVIGFFQEIYIAVIGNSYWTDTIDGIISKTDELKSVEERVAAFRLKIKDYFKDIKSDIKKEIEDLGLQNEFEDLKVTTKLLVKDLEIKTKPQEIKAKDMLQELKSSAKQAFQDAKIYVMDFVKTFREAIATGIVASLLFAFGNKGIKYLILSRLLQFVPADIATYFSNIVNQFQEFILPGIKNIGREFAYALIDEIKGFFSKLPAFLSGFASAFGALGNVLSGFISVFPALSMGLLAALVIAARTEGGLTSLWEMIAGKKNKEGKVKDAGIAQYFGSIFKEFDIFQGDSLFASNKLALAFGGVLTLAMSGAIGMVEATLLGAPLLMYALLGQDGGAKLIHDVSTFLFRSIGSLLTKFFSSSFGGLFATALFSSMSKFKLFFDNLFPKGPSSPLVQSLKDTLNLMTGMIKNFFANKAKYAAGDLVGLKGLLFANQNDEGSWESSLNPAGSFGSLGLALSDSLKDFSSKVKDFAKQMGRDLRKAFGLIHIAFRQMILGMLFLWMDFLPLLKDTLSSFVNFFKTKLGVLVAALAGFFAFSNTAQAFPMQDLVTSAAGSFASLAGNIALATTALVGLRVGYRLLNAYTKGKKNFIQDSIAGFASTPNQQAKQRLQALRAAIKVTNSRVFGVPGSVNLEEIADQILKSTPGLAYGFEDGKNFGGQKRDIESEQKKRTKRFEKTFRIKQKDSIKNAGRSAVSAEWAAMPGFIKDLTDQFKELGRYLKTTMSLGFFEGLWNIVIDLVRLIPNVLLGGLSRIFNLFETTSALGSAAGFLNDFVNGLFDFVKVKKDIPNVTKVIGPQLPFWQGLAVSIKNAGKAILKYFSAVKLIGKLLGVVGIGLTVGAIGTWLFGGSDALFTKLEWVYDKIKAIFGLQPTSDLGRFQATIKGLQDVSIGDITVDMTQALRNIDYKALSSGQFTMLNEVTSQAAQTFADMQKLFMEQGELTAAQQKELENTRIRLIKIIAQQPQKEELSLDENIQSIYDNMTFIDNSIWTRIKRGFGWAPVLEENSSSLANTLSDVGASIKQFGEKIKNFFSIDIGIDKFVKSISDNILGGVVKLFDAWSPEREASFGQKLDAREFKTLGTEWSKVKDFASDSSRNKVDEILGELELSTFKTSRFREQGVRYNTPEFKKQALAEAALELKRSENLKERAKQILFEETLLTRQKMQSEDVRKAIEDVVTPLKDLGGLDISENIGVSQEAFQLLKNYADVFTKLSKVVSKDLGSKLSLNKRQFANEEAAKGVLDVARGFVLLSSAVEKTAEILPSFSTAFADVFKSNNEAGFTRLLKSAEAYLSIQAKLKGLQGQDIRQVRDPSNPDIIRQVDVAEIARERLKPQAAAELAKLRAEYSNNMSGLASDLNNTLSRMQIDTLPVELLAKLSDSAIRGIQSQIQDAEIFSLET